MLSLGEISLFLTEQVYVLQEETPSLLEEVALSEEKDELEVPEEEKAIPPVPSAPHFRPILFISDELPKGIAEETFGNIVTKALGLNEQDYTFLTQESISFDKLENIASIKIVSFGIAFTGFQTKYKLNSASGKLVLYADSLENIAQNVELKRLLWTQLQMMFPKK